MFLTAHACSLCSASVRKVQLSRLKPEKSCFSPNAGLGNDFLHLLQPSVALKLKKPHSLRDAGMSHVTQTRASRQNLGPVAEVSIQTPSQKSNNSSTRGSKNELTSRLGS